MLENQKLKLPFTNVYRGSIKLHGPYGLIDQGYVNPTENIMSPKNAKARNAARRVLKEASKQQAEANIVDGLMLANERTRLLEERALPEAASSADQAIIASLATDPAESTLSERGMVLVPDEVSSLRIPKD